MNEIVTWQQRIIFESLTWVFSWCGVHVWMHRQSCPVSPYEEPPNSSWVLWWHPGGCAPPQWLSLEDAPLSRFLGPRTLPGTRPRPSSPRRHGHMSLGQRCGLTWQQDGSLQIPHARLCPSSAATINIITTNIIKNMGQMILCEAQCETDSDEAPQIIIGSLITAFS